MQGGALGVAVLGSVLAGGCAARCRPDGTIVLLTVFRKTRQHDKRQIDRAVLTQQVCERHHSGPAVQTYGRQA
jgi:hypothetical protein